MELYENINQIIKTKGNSKKEFVDRFLALEPKLKSTGELPTEATVYKYLNGRIAIRVELIPYIAEALRITEQELFTQDKSSRKKFLSNMLKTADKEEIAFLKEKLELKADLSNYICEPKNIYKETKTINDELISLLPFAPLPLKLSIINKLKDMKEFSEMI